MQSCLLPTLNSASTFAKPLAALSLGATVLTAFASIATFADAIKPNVLLIMSDDQGWGDLSIHGNPTLETPRIDELASQSARFEDFHVSPVCAPTRASLLTGRYHLRTGVSGTTNRTEVMREEEVTLAEIFSANGYRTGIFGKWHNGAEYPNHPNGQGFEEFIGFTAGVWNHYFDPLLQRNGEPYPTKGFIADTLTNEAMRFIETHRSKPFFCYVPLNTPHTPWQLPDKYYEKYAEQGLPPDLASAYGLCENIDDNVGRMLDKLDEIGLADQTIVIYLSDNGPNTYRFNGGMKGRKGKVNEGGTRVPFFMRWPSVISPKNVSKLTAHIDLLSTLVELCRLQEIPTLQIDGRSLVPLISEESASNPWPNRRVFFHNRRGFGDDLPTDPGAVRTERYRLVLPRNENAFELYDIVEDPSETRNLARAQPDALNELKSAYLAWFDEVRKGVAERPPISVGYEEFPTVVLDAASAEHSGATKYVNIHGWAHDWIINWTTLRDRIWWDLKVVESGNFQVELVYAVPTVSVGSTIAIEAGGQTLAQAITVPMVSEKRLRPDRDPDVTRWVREFATEPLGVLSLPKGEYQLTVKALNIPGEEVARFSALRLRRIN